MATDTTSIRPATFGDIISIIVNRAKIAGTVQDRDLNFIKGAVNEWHSTICTERNWHWRKFDRDFVFNRAVTTGTVAVTNSSRGVVFTGLTLDETYRGRSIKIDGTNELYRIVGVDLAANAGLLSNNYVGATNAAATFKIYQYEFPLPPDCDVISQVYIDAPYNLPGNGNGELEEKNVLEFNRILSSSNGYSGIPSAYTRDGTINANSSPPLDIMVANYDFLLGNEDEDVSKIRLLPIEPDASRLVHLNYSVHVEDLTENDQIPLIPIDNRWILVHFGLAEWHASNNSGTIADREFAKGSKMLREMRAEHHKTDVKPKIRINKRRFVREHISDRDRDLFLISRRV